MSSQHKLLLLLIAFPALLCALGSASPYCRWSGDPHFRTFDGVAHHFQAPDGNSTYYLARSENFEVKGHFLACGNPSYKVSCTREMQVIIKAPERLRRPGYLAYDYSDVVVTYYNSHYHGVEGWDKTVNFSVNGNYNSLGGETFRYIDSRSVSVGLLNTSDHSVMIQYETPDYKLNITLSRMRGLIEIDVDEDCEVNMTGLCGTPNRNFKDEFTTPDGSVLMESERKNYKWGVQDWHIVESWAMSHRESAGSFEALSESDQHVSDAPMLSFTSTEDMMRIVDACNSAADEAQLAVNTPARESAVKDCIFDAAATFEDGEFDVELARSNIEIEMIHQQHEQLKHSAKTWNVFAITSSLVAIVAIVSLVVVVIKLQREQRLAAVSWPAWNGGSTVAQAQTNIA